MRGGNLITSTSNVQALPKRPPLGSHIALEFLQNCTSLSAPAH